MHTVRAHNISLTLERVNPFLHYYFKGTTMSCSIKQQQTTSGYNSIPDAIAADDETAAVPFGTTLLPTSTTTNRSSKRMMMAIVALMMMLLLVVTAGTVWMRVGEIAAAEGGPIRVCVFADRRVCI